MVTSALRSSRDHFDSLFQHSPIASVVIDAEGLVRMCNPAFESLFLYSQSEVMGRELDALISSEECRHEAVEFSRNIFSGGTVKIRTQRWRKDGEVVEVEVLGSPIHDEFQVNGAIALYRDLTQEKRNDEERRQLEEQLRQSQKMEAIGRLAGGIAHDFNNLLMVIKGYTETLAESVPAADPRAAHIAKVAMAADQAASLTRQLLAFSRKQVLAPSVLDLNEVVEEMRQLLPRVLREDIDIVFRAGNDLGSVIADRTQLEQVVMNLAINARDAMPEGGKLTIETANVELDAAYRARDSAMKPGSYVMLAVSDTGHGMDEATRAKIFEPFFTTKPAGKGTGLGLSSVYGTVKQSGGTVWVYSEVGKGTTVKIYLPRVDEEPARRPRRHPNEMSARGGETVLLVEDQPEVREVAAMALRRRGYEVLEAATGEEAMRISAQFEGRIALLLTDVVMPGESGPMVSDALHKTRPAMKVIYMSGYTDRALEHRGAIGRNMPLLEKPFTLDSLARKVREVLDA